MGFLKLAAEIWRDFVSDGVEASGPWEPDKAAIRAWGATIEDRFQAPRQKIVADTVFYISPSSSDSTGDGTSGNPWKTRQKAYNTVAQSVDYNQQNVKIKLLDGTYTDTFVGNMAMVGQNGPAALIFEGNTSDPSAVIVNPTDGSNGYTFGSGVACLAEVSITDQELRSSGGHGFSFEGRSLVTENVRFGACAGAHRSVGHNGFYIVGGEHWITGGAAFHIIGGTNAIAALHGDKITVTTPVTIPVFCSSISGAKVFVAGLNVVNPGNITGQRFQAAGGSIYPDVGAAHDFLPGTNEGSIEGGGQYDYALDAGKLQSVSANSDIEISIRDTFVDATSGNLVMTIKTPATNFNGGITHGFTKIDSSGHTVTIKNSLGSTVWTLSTQWERVKLRSFGNAWYPAA